MSRSESLLGSSTGDSGYSDMGDSDASLLTKLKAKQTYLLGGTIALLFLIVLILAIAYASASHSSSSGSPPANATATNLRDLVTLDKLMTHARALQSIADSNKGNRYIHMTGFNATVAYIEGVLRQQTNLQVWKQYFTRPGFEVQGTPDMRVTNAIGDSFTLTYGMDYNTYIFSRSLPCGSGCPMAYVPNGGCAAADWARATPNVARGGLVVVQRSTAAACNATAVRNRAVQSGVLGVVVHNNDPMTGLLALEAPANTSIAMLSMTYLYGKLLEVAVSSANASMPVMVTLPLVTAFPETVVTNICADTPSGDPTSTIVIGSHSDGVITGSGIVDNGSGTCGNLVWATMVSQLLSTPGYAAYPNRLRFCWWGAEEQGLLGSKYHVQAATNATDIGMRLQDYQLNLNYDMIACPNFVFGVLNGSSGADFPATIPASVLPGSQALTDLFSSYFVSHNLPWDGKAFNGRSDYGPFLSAGIPAGGVSAFIDRLKTQEERDRYDRMLGTGMGGVPNIAIDPCYHQRCDTVANINPFAFEQIGKANGAVLEQLARMSPQALKALMFPQFKEGEQSPRYEPKEWPIGEEQQYE